MTRINLIAALRRASERVNGVGNGLGLHEARDIVDSLIFDNDAILGISLTTQELCFADKVKAETTH